MVSHGAHTHISFPTPIPISPPPSPETRTFTDLSVFSVIPFVDSFSLMLSSLSSIGGGEGGVRCIGKGAIILVFNSFFSFSSSCFAFVIIEHVIRCKDGEAEVIRSLRSGTPCSRCALEALVPDDSAVFFAPPVYQSFNPNKCEARIVPIRVRRGPFLYECLYVSNPIFRAKTRKVEAHTPPHHH